MTPIPFDYADYTQAERLSRDTTTFTNTQLGTQLEEVTGSRVLYDRTDSGQPLAMRGSNGDYYYLSDAIGSTTALASSTGAFVGRYRYEPYGEQISGPSVANPIRFQGQYFDTTTGLYKMGLRYYDPTVGRWTQKDPLNLFQDPRQANRYAFAGADPVNNADPAGAYICSGGGQCYPESRDECLAQGYPTGEGAPFGVCQPPPPSIGLLDLYTWVAGKIRACVGLGGPGAGTGRGVALRYGLSVARWTGIGAVAGCAGGIGLSAAE